MIPMAMVTAIIMIDKCCTIPTAVITLSSENTASSTTIWVITTQNAACTTGPSLGAWRPSNRSCSSMVPLNNRNIPPNIRIRSRPEKACPIMSNKGSVSVTIHAMDASKAKRISKASVRPTLRALLRCSGGSFSARIAIKTRLSIPSTISRITSVASPSHAEGSDIHSKIIWRSP